MIRYTQRYTGVRFVLGCPDAVKKRAIISMMASMPASRTTELPLCDHEWIEPFEEHEPGWLIPLIGFVSDKAISNFTSRIINIVKAIIRWRL